LTFGHKDGFMGIMKTTIEIPDPLFREAKATAARRGQSLKGFVTEAIRSKLSQGPDAPPPAAPWMEAFGGLKDLRAESRRIDKAIEAEFGTVDPADWT